MKKIKLVKLLTVCLMVGLCVSCTVLPQNKKAQIEDQLTLKSGSLVQKEDGIYNINKEGTRENKLYDLPENTKWLYNATDKSIYFLKDEKVYRADLEGNTPKPFIDQVTDFEVMTDQKTKKDYIAYSNKDDQKFLMDIEGGNMLPISTLSMEIYDGNIFYIDGDSWAAEYDTSVPLMMKNIETGEEQILDDGEEKAYLELAGIYNDKLFFTYIDTNNEYGEVCCYHLKTKDIEHVYEAAGIGLPETLSGEVKGNYLMVGYSEVRHYGIVVILNADTYETLDECIQVIEVEDNGIYEMKSDGIYYYDGKSKTSKCLTTTYFMDWYTVYKYNYANKIGDWIYFNDYADPKFLEQGDPSQVEDSCYRINVNTHKREEAERVNGIAFNY